jgi:hypothetical protein
MGRIGISTMIGIGVNRHRASSYWTAQSNFYELWKVTGAGNMVGLKRGDMLTITGSGLNAIYAVPDTDPYKTRDTDYVFHKSNGSVSTACDGNRLIGYDFPRVIVKYLDVSPYTIEYIGILDTGQSVNNKMVGDFHLPLYWSGVENVYGVIKGNRGLIQSVWTPEVTIQVPTGLTLSLISGGTKFDWTDTNSGAAQTEVWCRNDSDAYTTATYTIAAGTVTKSETITPVDLRYCKIRAKIGSTYSAFTTEESIAMLGANLVPSASSDFASDGSAWWSIIATSLTYNSGTHDVTLLQTGTGAGQLYRNGLMTVGKTYLVRFNVKSTNWTNKMKVSNASSGLMTDITNLNVSNVYQTMKFTGTQLVNQYVNFQPTGGTFTDKELTYDNIKVQEVL